ALPTMPATGGALTCRRLWVGQASCCRARTPVRRRSLRPYGTRSAEEARAGRPLDAHHRAATLQQQRVAPYPVVETDALPVAHLPEAELGVQTARGRVLAEHRALQGPDARLLRRGDQSPHQGPPHAVAPCPLRPRYAR